MPQFPLDPTFQVRDELWLIYELITNLEKKLRKHNRISLFHCTAAVGCALRFEAYVNVMSRKVSSGSFSFILRSRNSNSVIT